MGLFLLESVSADARKRQCAQDGYSFEMGNDRWSRDRYSTNGPFLGWNPGGNRGSWKRESLPIKIASVVLVVSILMIVIGWLRMNW